MMPRQIVMTWIKMLKISRGNDRFLLEVHPKLRPVETAVNGVVLAGTAQGPMNIQESLSAASAAAAKVAVPARPRPGGTAALRRCGGCSQVQWHRRMRRSLPVRRRDRLADLRRERPDRSNAPWSRRPTASAAGRASAPAPTAPSTCRAGRWHSTKPWWKPSAWKCRR